MEYISVSAAAELWGISERTVRNYCAHGKINGAFMTGKTWNIPADAKRPERSNKIADKPETLLERLRDEKNNGVKGGIYHKLQIELTYNSNHMEGSWLTHDQTRYIFETNTIGIEGEALRVDDIVETSNHFRCIDRVIENAGKSLSESFIKELHRTLKNGTSDSRKEWFAVGEYKKLPNEVGGIDTTPPELVGTELRKLLTEYNSKGNVTLTDLLNFHVRFERIHPFQDGNGRVGRLILLKECLKHNIVPFIIDDDMKMFYYRGLKEWNHEKGFLTDTCLAAQDKFKKWMDYFRIPYSNL